MEVNRQKKEKQELIIFILVSCLNSVIDFCMININFQQAEKVLLKRQI